MALEGKEKECVAIARDALKQIEAKKYIGTHMTYLLEAKGCQNPLSEYYGEELQPHIKKLKPCRVCAIGALFLSAVRKYDDCRDPHLHFQKLSEFFGYDELNAIEAKFERGPIDIRRDRGDRLLKAILRNIVKNKGHFVAEEVG